MLEIHIGDSTTELRSGSPEYSFHIGYCSTAIFNDAVIYSYTVEVKKQLTGGYRIVYNRLVEWDIT
jgi:hypothetical protein